MCNRTFTSCRGCQTHIGMKHGDALGTPGSRKRPRAGAVPPPLPAPVAVPPAAEQDDHDGAMPDQDGDMPALQSDAEADAQEEAAAQAHAPARELTAHEQLVEAARVEAQEMLLDPTWRKIARDSRLHCEEILQDVGQLYPSEEQFPTRETYRYSKLYYEHPGASFGRELLKEERVEHLDLSKVAHPFSWSHMRRICVAYATSHWT